MKKLTLITVLTIISVSAFSQKQREKLETVNPIYQEYLPLENGLITYTEVFKVDSVSKDDLFIKINEWVVKTFKSPKDVIQMADKDAGKIMCKTIFYYTVGKGLFSYPMNIFYLIDIEVREGRYKIKASNFINHYSINLGAVKNEGEMNLEKLFLLKEPTKKEFESNMQFAKVLQENIKSIFDSSFIMVSDKKTDNW